MIWLQVRLWCSPKFGQKQNHQVGRVQGAISPSSRPEFHRKLFRVFLPLEMLIPMAEVSRPVLLRTVQKLRQNRKQVVMAHLKTSINGDGAKYSILDLKQKDQLSHKGTCSPALCQPAHWALLHVPASEVWAPPMSILHPLRASLICHRNVFCHCQLFHRGWHRATWPPPNPGELCSPLSALELIPQVKTTFAHSGLHPREQRV